MKKIMTVLGICLPCMAVNAQDTRPIYYFKYDSEMFQIAAMIFVVGMFMYFIIDIMKRIFEHRLKNKIVDKGISENIAQSILATQKPEDNRYANVKWFAILAGIGLGLTGVNYTQPLGFHSLAIMAFSISLSFLGYYFFTRSAGK
jgi:drug/metabolite transporter (DMT)-like permease